MSKVARAVQVHIDKRELEKLVRSAVEDLRTEYDDMLDEAVEEHDAIPRATLADLLGFDQTQSTPTWDAIFGAVDGLMVVRRG